MHSQQNIKIWFIVVLSPQRLRFSYRPVHMRFVRDRVALVQISIQTLQLSHHLLLHHCSTSVIQSPTTNAI